MTETRFEAEAAFQASLAAAKAMLADGRIAQPDFEAMREFLAERHDPPVGRCFSEDACNEPPSE